MEKNYVVISQDNVKRFKNLAESPLIVENFKKEIRTKLLRFYYDNDMIGELDAFLEDIEADQMEVSERAEFIKYLISRGMFDKAYYWIKSYGVTDVDPKSVARLVSKRIVSREFEYEEFLVNVAHYIYKNMKYDENILRYLMMNYDGKVTELRKLWKSAVDLELETRLIMERILRQTEYTGVMVQDRDEILISYAHCEEHDAALVNKILMDMAYDYFVCEAIVCPEIFDMLYQKYAKGELTDRRCSLALLKFWAENRQGMEIPDDTVRQLIQELLKEEGIERTESFIALTGIDEENILLTLHARQVSNAKVITKINRITFKDVINHLDLGSVVYPRYITSEAIIAYVRAKRNSMDSNIETLYHMFDHQVEAIEFRVYQDSKVTGTPLMNLPLKKNLLVSFINRNGSIIIPSGQDSIQVGDSVMIVTTHTGFKDILDILE